MLALPTKGISRSVDEHNVELDVFCDWIEGSILFSNEEKLSSTDVVDVLLEGLIYDDQSFAVEMVADAWSELQRRKAWIGAGAPFSVEHRRIKRLRSWQDEPAHSFCVLLALSVWYSGWARQFGSDYTEQGELFELLTKESLEHQFSDWQIHHTGWSRTRAVKLAEVVSDIADRLGEAQGQLEPWAIPDANDAGLDLLCYRPFPDSRVGIPVYLVQCASGGNWEEKLHMPELKVWTKVIQFAATPRKAFATPFAFLDDVFANACNIVDGMLLDRCRLLAACRHCENWVSPSLRDRIIAWTEPRVAALPRGDV